eukprot:gene4930-21270_t
MQGLGIDKRRTTAYNPRSNGLTEQSNSIVKTYLTAALEQNKLVSNVWDKWLQEACYAYNTSVHSTTGFSPAELMFGRRFRVPIDILYGTFENTESNLSLQSYKDKLNSMYDTAREHMNQRQARYAAYHDKNVIDDKLSVGDYVYVYLPRLARVKLIAKWNGPFKILKASHPVYSIEIPSNKGTLIKTVTRDKLKRAPESVMNTTVLHVPTDDVTNSQSSDEIFAESDSEEELDEPRYNLRPRRNVVRYNEELISNIKFDESATYIYIFDELKVKRKRPYFLITLPSLNEEDPLGTAKLLQIYLDKTEHFRQSNDQLELENRLFLSYVPSHKPVTTDTIAGGLVVFFNRLELIQAFLMHTVYAVLLPRKQLPVTLLWTPFFRLVTGLLLKHSIAITFAQILSFQMHKC